MIGIDSFLVQKNKPIKNATIKATTRLANNKLIIAVVVEPLPLRNIRKLVKARLVLKTRQIAKA